MKMGNSPYPTVSGLAGLNQPTAWRVILRCRARSGTRPEIHGPAAKITCLAVTSSVEVETRMPVGVGRIRAPSRAGRCRPGPATVNTRGRLWAARLINNPRRTKIGHVEAFPVLHMRSLRKSAMFSEGQRTEGHFRYPGASNAITIIVDLRSEHDLKVLLKVGHADSATNMQVIGLTHRPTGFNGRRWYFVSKNGKRAETLFLVGGFFRTRREAGLTYRSQSMGELDRALDRRRKLQAQLEGTGARGPARGRRRKQC